MSSVANTRRRSAPAAIARDTIAFLTDSSMVQIKLRSGGRMPGRVMSIDCSCRGQPRLRRAALSM